MNEIIHSIIEKTATGIEVIGILIIAFGSLFSLIRFLFNKQGKTYRSFQRIREELGRAILLGLEFLVAADIIATVVYDTTMNQVLKLGVVVLIRTFLSFALEIEMEGKVPWKQSGDKTTGKK